MGSLTKALKIKLFEQVIRKNCYSGMMIIEVLIRVGEWLKGHWVAGAEGRVWKTRGSWRGSKFPEKVWWVYRMLLFGRTLGLGSPPCQERRNAPGPSRSLIIQSESITHPAGCNRASHPPVSLGQKTLYPSTHRFSPQNWTTLSNRTHPSSLYSLATFAPVILFLTSRDYNYKSRTSKLLFHSHSLSAGR